MISRRRVLQVASLWALSPTILAQSGATRILLVHGRDQQGQDPVRLKAQWMQALSKGAATFGRSLPDDIQVAFPYYADVLDKFTRELDVPLASDIQARGDPMDDEFLQFQARLAEEVRQGAGISDAQVDAEYGPNPKPKGPLNWEWVQATLRAVDKNGGGLSQKALETFTRDVFLYTTRTRVRDEIDRIVAAELTDEPTVVVGHSLGSVVAYHVLRSDRRSLRVPLYVSVGSPLGVRSVRDQFRPLTFPSPVKSWYNAFDPRDVVALYPLDDSNFPVRPSVENNSRVNNHTGNHHGIVGYLDDRAVAGQILGALRS